MDLQTALKTKPQQDQTISEPVSQTAAKPSIMVRVLKNPLFLVVFTWVLMAFLLAFEVSGK